MSKGFQFKPSFFFSFVILSKRCKLSWSRCPFCCIIERATIIFQQLFIDLRNHGCHINKRRRGGKKNEQKFQSGLASDE